MLEGFEAPDLVCFLFRAARNWYHLFSGLPGIGTFHFMDDGDTQRRLHPAMVGEAGTEAGLGGHAGRRWGQGARLGHWLIWDTGRGGGTSGGKDFGD